MDRLEKVVIILLGVLGIVMIVVLTTAALFKMRDMPNNEIIYIDNMPCVISNGEVVTCDWSRYKGE